MRSTSLVTEADLQALGWPQILINDYFNRLNDFSPQSGTDADPNGIYLSNANGFYVDTVTPALWYNPTIGELTGWIQIP